MVVEPNWNGAGAAVVELPGAALLKLPDAKPKPVPCCWPSFWLLPKNMLLELLAALLSAPKPGMDEPPKPADVEDVVPKAKPLAAVTPPVPGALKVRFGEFCAPKPPVLAVEAKALSPLPLAGWLAFEPKRGTDALSVEPNIPPVPPKAGTTLVFGGAFVGAAVPKAEVALFASTKADVIAPLVEATLAMPKVDALVVCVEPNSGVVDVLPNTPVLPKDVAGLVCPKTGLATCPNTDDVVVEPPEAALPENRLPSDALVVAAKMDAAVVFGELNMELVLAVDVDVEAPKTG